MLQIINYDHITEMRCELYGLIFFQTNSKSSESDVTCKTICEGTISRKEACIETKYMEELNPKLTFYLHLAIRILFEFTLGWNIIRFLVILNGLTSNPRTTPS